MDYGRLRTLLIGTLFLVSLLFIVFVAIVRKLRKDIEAKKNIEPDDVFYQNLKTALEKQHALNQEVQRREQFQKAILDNISVGVAVLDKYKKFREVNSFFRSLFGVEGQVAGKTIIDLGLPDEFVDFVKSINFSMLFSPVEHQVKAGNKIFLIRVSKINYFQNEEGMLLLIHDITELENAKKKLELKNRLEYIGEMSASMAHEFKNAISTVKGYAQMILSLLDEKKSKPKEYASRILRESENINEVVNKFLLYARPLQLSVEEIEVSDLLTELKTKFEKFPYIEFSSKPENFVFKGDRLLLKQCFANIVRNAVEGVKGIDNPKIRVSFEKNGKEGLVFKVKDNGRGIPDHEISRVFVPFFTTKSEGTGLGLAICEKIIAKHNGVIEVNSEENKGTEVVVRI